MVLNHCGIKSKLIQQLIMTFLMVYKFRQLHSYRKSKHKSKLPSLFVELAVYVQHPKWCMGKRAYLVRTYVEISSVPGGELGGSHIYYLSAVPVCSSWRNNDPNNRKVFIKFVATSNLGLINFKWEICIKKFHCCILRKVIITDITFPYKK